MPDAVAAVPESFAPVAATPPAAASPSPVDDPSAIGQTEAADAAPTAEAADAAPTAEAADAAPTVDAAGSAAAPEPVRLRIERFAIDHQVVPVALDPDGAMELPDDVGQIGWFEPGVRPGASGSAVLAGHVDDHTQGRGALFDIGQLEPDDVVEVVMADGAVQRWQVVGRATYRKDTLPIPELFRRGGEPQLVLITCGGPFDTATRHYRDNVVVIAAPA